MPTSTSTRGERFHAYVERLSSALGHRDRHGPLRDYVTGLCLPGDRKSIEPMAARVDPRHVRARHQSMHHFVANAAWDDAAVLRVARETVLAALERHGPVAAWVVDDTGMPKKGRHSVGVARQYCGVLGKQENCQVAVSVSLAHEQASVPVAYRLYLPEAWAQDRRRRRAARPGLGDGAAALRVAGVALTPDQAEVGLDLMGVAEALSIVDRSDEGGGDGPDARHGAQSLDARILGSEVFDDLIGVGELAVEVQHDGEERGEVLCADRAPTTLPFPRSPFRLGVGTPGAEGLERAVRAGLGRVYADVDGLPRGSRGGAQGEPAPKEVADGHQVEVLDSVEAAACVAHSATICGLAVVPEPRNARAVPSAGAAATRRHLDLQRRVHGSPGQGEGDRAHDAVVEATAAGAQVVEVAFPDFGAIAEDLRQQIREQSFGVEGAGAGMAALTVMSALTLVLPTFTVGGGVGSYSQPQLWFVALSSLLLWALF